MKKYFIRTVHKEDGKEEFHIIEVEEHYGETIEEIVQRLADDGWMIKVLNRL